MSKEHVLPQWLSILGSDEMGGAMYEIDRGGKPVATPLIEVRTRRVCVDCNTGWLANIEGGAQRVMAPIIANSTEWVTEQDRWVIARWISKTLLTFPLATTARIDSSIVPSNDYQIFYNKAQPFTNMVLMMGGYTGKVLPIQFQLQGPGAAVGGWFYFHFLRLVLFGLIFKVADYSAFRLPGWINEAAHIVWPPDRALLWVGDPTRRMSWPPTKLFDQPAVDALKAALPTAAIP